MVKKCPISAPRAKDGSLMVESEELEMIHLDLLSAVIQLVNAPSQRGWCQFEFVEKMVEDGDGNEVRAIDELWTAEWWRCEEAKLATVSKKILAIGLATDETTLTMTNRKLQPVYAFSYNYGEWWRNKASGWTLIGMLPIVRPVLSHANSDKVRLYRRLVHRWQMGELMSSTIQRASGMFVQIVNGDGVKSMEWMYPRFPFAVADEPEMKASFIGAKVSSTSSRPCNLCMIKPSDDTIYKLGVPRDSLRVRQVMPKSFVSVIESNVRDYIFNEHSLHVEYNPMWDVPGYDPFCQPGCILHQLDSGVFEVILSRTVEWLRRSSAGPASVEVFDHRWSRLCMVPGGKIFYRGVSDASNVSMAEHRLMTMGLPFVLHGMTETAHFEDFGDGRHTVSGQFLEEVSVTYLCWRWLLSSDVFTVEILDVIQEYGCKLIRLIERFSRILNGDVNGAGDLSIKIHKILHWTQWIAQFGSPRLYSSETFESAHKEVKCWKGNVSWKHSHAAGHRVMTMNAVYNAHAEQAEARRWSDYVGQSQKELYSLIGLACIPSGWLHRSEHAQRPVRKDRWGPGQFRGRLSTSKAFDLGGDDYYRMVEYECLHEWFEDEDRDEVFIRSLISVKKEDLLIILQVLRRMWFLMSKFVTRETHPTVSFSRETGEPKLLAVTGEYRRDLTYGVLRLWNKMWIAMPTSNEESRGYYVDNGMFVKYYHTVKGVSRTLIGRVHCMLSFSTQQAVVLRRTNIARRKGPSGGADDFLCRHRGWKAEKNVLPKTVEEHFIRVSLLPIGEGSAPALSFHVVFFGQESEFEIGEIASLQPDFSSESHQPDGVHVVTRFYLMDYVVLWD